VTQPTGDEARKLALGFATALEHLRDTWGVLYVGSSPMPPNGAEARPAEARPAEARPAEARPAVERAPGPAGSPAARGGNTSALRAQAAGWSAATKLEYLRRKNLGDCRRCGLCQTRTNIVFGVGNAEAELMFVGEAPGGDEDRQGEPFVGRAGQRLDQWIAELGLRREDVYIANVLKCRPPGNRDPKPEEVDRCSPFLKAQIRAIRPKVLVALGRHAGMLLSAREDLTLRALRSARLSYDASGRSETEALNIPLVVTYHPAYVLRQEGASGSESVTELVMQDLRRALSIARG
jgi:uracil-DNA glycosylase